MTRRPEDGSRHGLSATAFIRLAFVALVSVSLSSHARADIDDGLIAHWNFDDCAAVDVTGNGYDGSLSGGPVCGDGFEGNALDFDGINDHIRLARTLDANSVRAISFWINSRGPDGRNDGGLVLAKYNWSGRRSFLIYTHNGTTSAITAVFYADGRTYASDNVSSFYEDPESLDPGKYTVTNNTKLATNTWEHVVVNVTDSDIEIWINGHITNKVKRRYQSYYNSGEPTYIGNAFRIGGDFTFDFRLNGVLDNYRIYDRPLTEDEIQELALRKMSIRPTAGGDTGDVTARIYGDGFQEGAEVRLVRAGETDIVGRGASVGPYGRTISTTFDLTDKTRGLWDLVVQSPDGSIDAISEGFRIEEGQVARVWTDILGRSVIRPDREQRFYIQYGNRGNVDARGVTLSIAGVPEEATLKLDFELTSLPPVNEGDQVAEFPDYIIVDNEKVVPLYLPSIPPGFVGTLGIAVTAPRSVDEFVLRAWAEPPAFLNSLNPDVAQCWVDIFTTAVGLYPGMSCFMETWDTQQEISLDILSNIFF